MARAGPAGEKRTGRTRGVARFALVVVRLSLEDGSTSRPS